MMKVYNVRLLVSGEFDDEYWSELLGTYSNREAAIAHMIDAARRNFEDPATMWHISPTKKYQLLETTENARKYGIIPDEIYGGVVVEEYEVLDRYEPAN